MTELGAPTGSIYHRYARRERLPAELWLEVVEGFQDRFVAALAEARHVSAGAKVARFMPSWTREHPLEARLLLLHRRQDFLPDAWPLELVERAAALEPQLGAALRGFTERAFGQSGRRGLEVTTRLRFALLDAPFGGIRPYVQAGQAIPPLLDDLVERAALASLSDDAQRWGPLEGRT